MFKLCIVDYPKGAMSISGPSLRVEDRIEEYAEKLHTASQKISLRT